MLSHQRIVLVLGDIVSLIVSFCAMAVIRFDISSQGDRIWQQMGLFGVLFAVWLIVFFIFDLYTPQRINPNPRNIGLMFASMAVNVLLGVLLFYVVPNTGISPKTNLAILAICTLLSLVIWRRIFYLIFTKHIVRKIILVGKSPLIANLATELARHRHVGVVVGVWDVVPEDTISTEVDLLIADAVNPEALLALSRKLNTQTISLVEAYETILAKIPVELLTPERALQLMTDRSTPASRAIYRILEIIGASLVLIATSPFLLITGIAKWIEDGGPVFIKQRRVGKDGEIFSIYKLRSMKALAPDGSAETGGVQWAQQKDPRITPIGHILRTTHIDEIPQMYNIIKGDLAVIGPRAERPEFVEQLEQQIPYYYLRHTSKPGFTGWAQIKFRYARSIEDSKEKFEYDLYYLKNKGVLLDIGIILKTLQIMFTH
jgi:lipopolysaccharide/colanic/teichoic acid biosynthesis glycosyltransferase